MLLLDRLERWLYESGRPQFLGTVVFLIMFRAGFWYIPNIDVSLALAQDPFTNPLGPPEQHYLFFNWLSAFLAWKAGALTLPSYILLHAAFSVAFLVTMLVAIWTSLSERDARTATIVLFVLPVSGTALYWIGPDGLTLLLIALAILLRRWPAVLCIIGVGLGLQQFEQSAIAFGVLFLSSILSRGSLPWWKFAVSTLAGVLLGKLLLQYLIASYAIPIASDRASLMLKLVPIFAYAFATHWHIILWGTLGAGWLFVLRLLDFKELRLPFIVALVPLLLLMGTVGDQTRVFAVCSLPLLACWWMLNPGFLAAINGRSVALVGGVGAILPYPWVYASNLQPSLVPFDIVYLMSRFLGWPVIDRPLAFWPFV